VSSTHWLYMIQQRLGNPKKADSLHWCQHWGKSRAAAGLA
jgi:hypothetical protein